MPDIKRESIRKKELDLESEIILLSISYGSTYTYN